MRLSQRFFSWLQRKRQSVGLGAHTVQTLISDCRTLLTRFSEAGSYHDALMGSKLIYSILSTAIMVYGAPRCPPRLPTGDAKG